MAQWSVVTDRPTVPVWLVADDVLERSDMDGNQVRWVVELPVGAEPILRMLRGVISVRPALKRIHREAGRRDRAIHVVAGSLKSSLASAAAPGTEVRPAASDR